MLLLVVVVAVVSVVVCVWAPFFSPFIPVFSTLPFFYPPTFLEPRRTGAPLATGRKLSRLAARCRLCNCPMRSGNWPSRGYGRKVRKLQSTFSTRTFRKCQLAVCRKASAALLQFGGQKDIGSVAFGEGSFMHTGKAASRPKQGYHRQKSLPLCNSCLKTVGHPGLHGRRSSADALFNSKSLRSAGRSPARFLGASGAAAVWQSQLPPGLHPHWGSRRNRCEFWVLQSRLQGCVMPAQAVVTPQVAKMVANLIASEGPELEKWLCKAGIAKDGELELKALQKYMQQYCAVLEGHLAQVSWPRVRRKLKKPVPGKLCTCREFLLHGDCEHVLYVKALQDDPTADMRNIPTQRRRGRKRKTW